MCDYDGEGWLITKSGTCKTRKPHLCGGCYRLFPAGTVMRWNSGVNSDGWQTDYICLPCAFAEAQPEESPLHICFGDVDGAGKYDDVLKVHAYVRHCLENGETPTETGLEAALRQHAELAALEL